jgi:hypothetical protein
MSTVAAATPGANEPLAVVHITSRANLKRQKSTRLSHFGLDWYGGIVPIEAIPAILKTGPDPKGTVATESAGSFELVRRGSMRLAFQISL